MTISSSAAWRRLAAAAVLAASVMASAIAQDAAPKPEPPVSLLPVPVAAPDAPAEPAIAVGELTAPGIDRIGLVDVSKGGFPAEVWAGTTLDALTRILPQLPRRMTSHAARQIAINLLLSPGTAPPVPEHTDRPLPEDSPSSWLLETRVAALAALGAWNDALALLELVPADQMTEALMRLRADGLLVTNRVSAACGDAQNALKTSTESYWQKVQVFCQFTSGQASAAGLGLDVLREQRVDDPVFFWLAGLLAENRAPAPENVAALQPLHLAMLRKSGGAVPEGVLNTTDPTTLGVLAALPMADQAPVPGDKTPAAVRRERLRLAVEARILMAERAVALGTLDPDVLRALYRQWDSKLDPNPPSLTKLTPEDVRGRALLYQSALVQTVPTARAEVIGRALEMARNDRGKTGPDLVTVGRVYTPMIADMPDGTEMQWFADAAARALFAAGEREPGMKWFDFLRNMTRNSSAAVMAFDCVLPLELMMAPGAFGRLPDHALACWAHINDNPERVGAERDAALNLLTAVGYEADSADWLAQTNLFQSRPLAPALAPPLWNSLTAAARARRTGETAVLALIAIGEGNLAEVPALSLHQVIHSLVTSGREQDGRALAVEAALVQGF